MLFQPKTFSVKILSVLLLSWDENNAHIDARPFRAISFRIQGDADFILPGYRVHAGMKSIVYSPEGIDYEVRAGSERVIVVHFSVDSDDPGKFQSVIPKDKQRAEALFTYLLECWENKRPGYYYHAVSIFYQIMELLEKQTALPAHSSHYDKIRVAVDHLQQNYRNPELTVEQLCRIAGLSTTYFRKCFYEEFATTPNKYLNVLRIDYAKALLESNMYSVERTAEEAGFLDPKYFCVVFKKITGQTPSEFKKSPSLRSPR